MIISNYHDYHPINHAEYVRCMTFYMINSVSSHIYYLMAVSEGAENGQAGGTESDISMCACPASVSCTV